MHTTPLAPLLGSSSAPPHCAPRFVACAARSLESVRKRAARSLAIARMRASSARAAFILSMRVFMTSFRRTSSRVAELVLGAFAAGGAGAREGVDGAVARAGSRARAQHGDGHAGPAVDDCGRRGEPGAQGLVLRAVLVEAGVTAVVRAFAGGTHPGRQVTARGAGVLHSSVYERGRGVHKLTYRCV